MSRLSRTASAIRLAAARAVAGAQMTKLTATPSRIEADSWRPCANADLSRADFSNRYVLDVDGSSKQRENKQDNKHGNKQGERELLLA